MKTKALSIAGLAALAIGVSACGGGSGSSAPIPTPAPTIAPTAKPTVAPTATPSPSPTPTTAPAGGSRAVAVTLTTASGQHVVSALTRKALAGGVAAFPSIIESLGDLNSGTSVNVWEYDTTTGDPVSDGTPTITPANVADSTVLAVAPITVSGFTDAFQAGVSPLAVGLTAVNVAFASASAAVPVDIYDGFDFRCDGQLPYTGYVFTAGAISHTTTSAGADFYMDCSVPGQISIDFPHGGFEADAPVTDAYGSTSSQFASVLTAPTVPSTTLYTLTNAATLNGEIVAFNTGEGRVAKLMFENNPGDDPLGSGIFGLVMEASAGGTFAY